MTILSNHNKKSIIKCPHTYFVIPRKHRIVGRILFLTHLLQLLKLGLVEGQTTFGDNIQIHPLAATTWNWQRRRPSTASNMPHFEYSSTVADFKQHCTKPTTAFSFRWRNRGREKTNSHWYNHTEPNMETLPQSGRCYHSPLALTLRFLASTICTAHSFLQPYPLKQPALLSNSALSEKKYPPATP